MTSPSGQISALNTLPEGPHRRLLSLANQLFSALPATGGLNAKAYRQPSGSGRATNVGVDTAAGRSATVVDGAMLARWAELGSAKRAEVSGKGGYDGVTETRAELESVLGWASMAYF